MKSDSSKILYVINDAAVRYKDIIPDNCWHEPYMSEQELVNELNAGVRMFGYNRNNKLIAVIGIQKIKDVVLIRHAYTLISYQSRGTGSTLLKNLLKKNQKMFLASGSDLSDAKSYLIDNIHKNGTLFRNENDK